MNKAQLIKKIEERFEKLELDPDNTISNRSELSWVADQVLKLEELNIRTVLEELESIQVMFWEYQETEQENAIAFAVRQLKEKFDESA